MLREINLPFLCAVPGSRHLMTHCHWNGESVERVIQQRVPLALQQWTHATWTALRIFGATFLSPLHAPWIVETAMEFRLDLLAASAMEALFQLSMKLA